MNRRGGEHTSMGGSSVEHQSAGDVTANSNCVRSVCEEVQCPDAKCGTQDRSANFAVTSRGHIRIRIRITAAVVTGPLDMK